MASMPTRGFGAPPIRQGIASVPSRAHLQGAIPASYRGSAQFVKVTRSSGPPHQAPGNKLS